MVKVAVVGGGAAGMMAAIAAAEEGAETFIFERNPYLGKKLGITGKGRCNLTNACTIQDFIKNVPGNGSFLYSALHQLNMDDTMEFFSKLGVELKIERGRRVFPVADDAYVVVNALKRRLRELGVKVNYNSRVSELLAAEGQIQGLLVDREPFYCDAVVLATGGKSYPATGSTGDGYTLASALGHTIVMPRPSLVPLETKEEWPAKLSGLALKNVEIIAKADDRVIDKAFGEMLFTHFGVSGPIILSLSHAVIQVLGQAEVRLYINLKPALSPEQLEQRIQRDFLKFTRKHFRNALSELLPASLIPVMIELCGIAGDKPVNQITREERGRLRELLCSLPLTVKCTRGLEEAIVTAGGVNTKEIDPKTMVSKLVNGLYFAGEIMDVDGLTGGYNLQIAWSSGYVAGKSAAGE